MLEGYKNMTLSYFQVKSLSTIAEKLGCNLLQLQVAWQVRNQTVQSTTISASTPEALMELLQSLTVKLNLRIDIVMGQFYFVIEVQ